MIEVPAIIDVTKGITPYEEKLSCLHDSVNLYPKEDALKSVHTLNELWTESTSWPWPQLIKLEDQLYKCYEDEIMVLRPDGWQVLISGVSNRHYPWGAAVVGAFPVFTNNVVVVHPNEMDLLRIRRQDLAFDYLVAQATLFPVARDICEYNAQFIVAAPWMYEGWNPHHVAWAKPGTIDFSVGPKSAAGISFVQGCGDILRVVDNEHGFVAYGTEGVAIFKQTTYPASYSHVRVSTVGLYSQLAVAKASDRHIYLGTNLKLYQVTPDGVKELGYEYKFKDAEGEVALHYDEEENLFYASL
jgi:hypothetical protein